jgi:DNA-directed RNA polymerase III subunit RPC1
MLEDLHLAYDLTVRSCDTKEVIQFTFGEDGLDPTVLLKFYLFISISRSLNNQLN